MTLLLIATALGAFVVGVTVGYVCRRRDGAA